MMNSEKKDSEVLERFSKKQIQRGMLSKEGAM
jgi:hypothetical protein